MILNCSSDTYNVFYQVEIETVKLKSIFFELFEFFTNKLAQPYEMCHKTEDDGQPNDEFEEGSSTQNRKEGYQITEKWIKEINSSTN